MRNDTLRRHCAGLLIACFALAVPLTVRAQSGSPREHVASAAAGSPLETNVTYSAFPIAQGTKVKKVPFPTVGVPVPTGATYFIVTTLLQLFAVSPTVAGLKATNGRADLTTSCFGDTTETHRTRVRLKDGNAINTEMMAQSNGCNFAQTWTAGRGGATTPMDSNGSVMTSVQPWNPASLCTPDENTMCLQDSRFQVEVDWKDFAGKGKAVSFPTAPDAGTFYFFDPANTDLVVKVLDGCNVAGFNSFWVFAGAATNVEYTLTVTDTQTGQAKTYFNPLGTAAAAIQDTDAFATCP